MPAVLDDSDVDVDDIAFFQSLLVGNAVADLMIDRGANRLRVSVVARWRVVQRRRGGALNLSGVVLSDLVQLVGGDAGFDESAKVVEQLPRQPARHAHPCNALRVFVSDSHGTGLSHWGPFLVPRRVQVISRAVGRADAGASQRFAFQ